MRTHIDTKGSGFAFCGRFKVPTTSEIGRATCLDCLAVAGRSILPGQSHVAKLRVAQIEAFLESLGPLPVKVESEP